MLLAERDALISEGELLRSQLAGRVASVKSAAASVGARARWMQVRHWADLLRRVRRTLAVMRRGSHGDAPARSCACAGTGLGTSTEAQQDRFG